MVGVDMKGLITLCGGTLTRLLNAACGFAMNRGHYEVCPEHLFAAALEDKANDIALLLEGAGCKADDIQKAIARCLDEMRFGNSNRPFFAPALQTLLEDGWLVSSVELKASQIRSAGLLFAFLRRPGLYAQSDWTRVFANLERDRLQKDFASLTAASPENEQATASPTSASPQKTSAGGESFLGRFCEDFTAKAKEGKLDPVFGRDQEIRQMVDILARRRKNNPILVGNPGTGKTAVLEGLALRIVQGDVPETLLGVRLLSLDMGLLEAGASVKGEFERRLKGVLDEIKASPSPIILFIDEAHLLVGAGNSQGGSDAANLMKPALARGEIRTCAATTWKEYKKYFEKDPALVRRFQLVKLDEPSQASTVLILRGLVPSYEKAHNVLIRDEAVKNCAALAERYIQGRYQPDKAIDLLDTACARVRVALKAMPAPLEECIHERQALEREERALLRERDNNQVVDSVRLAEISATCQELLAKEEALRTRWQAEQEAAHALIAARQALSELRSNGVDESAENFVAAKELVQTSEARLQAIQGDEPLMAVEVTAEVVARVVSDWTGIPLGKVAKDQASMVADLERLLSARVKGQTAAIKAIVEGIQASKAGLRSPSQPQGVFLLVGPSGTGKTETGLSLADILFGDERSVVTINMSEFQEKHTVSRLIGSPPGYVGYGEGGMLTEAVRRKPYSVVLLDEVEKAHPDVMQLFYQVFDKGMLTDGEGTEVSFRNTIILLTSNLASDITQALCEEVGEEGIDTATLLAAIRPVLSKHFQPALLARMHIVPYISLGQEQLAAIATLKLNALAQRAKANTGMELRFADDLATAIAKRCTETETGARNIEYILQGSILPTLAKRVLSAMAEQDEQKPLQAFLGLDEQGELRVDFS